jgi:DNA-binding transcriptional MerR regulator
MDLSNLISRLEIASKLGVQSRTIVQWERLGWFPRPTLTLSLKRIYYNRDEVQRALDARANRKPRVAWSA